MTCEYRHGTSCAIAASLYEAHTDCTDAACAVCCRQQEPRAVNSVTVSLALSAAASKDRTVAATLYEAYGHLLVAPGRKVDVSALAALRTSNGPGGHLFRLLEQIGIKHTPTCHCVEYAQRMDAWGVAGCRLARAEIVEHLRANAGQYGWGTVAVAVLKAVATGLAFRLSVTDPFGSLVDEAIRRSVAAATPAALTVPYHAPRNDTAAVTCSFATPGDTLRLRCYHEFSKAWRRTRIPLLTVEGSFSGTFALAEAVPYELEDRSRMFLKENLLNRAMCQLPDGIDRIIWIDCDLTVDADDYADRLAAVLDAHPVAQGFSSIRYRDERGGWATKWLPSLAARRSQRAGPQRGRVLPGGAWAARRDLLQQVGGLYDRVITGGGDSVWSCAVYGQLDAVYLPLWPAALIADVERYIASVHPHVGSVGCVDARVVHLYHGAYGARRYGTRNQALLDHGFDPRAHLEYSDVGTLRWTSSAPEALRRLIGQYMTS